MTITAELSQEKLTISYDTQAKAAYIRVKTGAVARTQEEIPDRLNIDFDAQGNVLGIEVLRLSTASLQIRAALRRLAKSRSLPALAHLRLETLPGLYA